MEGEFSRQLPDKHGSEIRLEKQIRRQIESPCRLLHGVVMLRVALTAMMPVMMLGSVLRGWIGRRIGRGRWLLPHGHDCQEQSSGQRHNELLHLNLPR